MLVCATQQIVGGASEEFTQFYYELCVRYLLGAFPARYCLYGNANLSGEFGHAYPALHAKLFYALGDFILHDILFAKR